ncbi:MAG: GatB/YqeY domain-containing protein [Alphaproteobacteria bacterium]|nr:GatB/YqeY domain-containing protein [Alphaproteobacteria bacterium]
MAMLRDDMNDALKDAMRARDTRKTATLRLILAAVKDRDIAAREDGKRDLVGDDEILNILQKMVRQRREAIESFEQAGRLEMAEQEAEEIRIIEEFLPRQMDDEEIETAVKQAIGEVEASSLKDMGKVMTVLRDKYAGQMEFAKASAVAKQELS